VSCKRFVYQAQSPTGGEKRHTQCLPACNIAKSKYYIRHNVISLPKCETPSPNIYLIFTWCDSLHFAWQQSSTSKNNVCNVSTPCYQGMSHSYVEYCYQIKLNCLLSYILPGIKFTLLPKIAIQIAIASFTYPINIFGVEISSHVTEVSHHINIPLQSCLMQGCPLMRESKH